MSVVLSLEKEKCVEEEEQVDAGGGLKGVFHEHGEHETAPEDDLHQVDFRLAEEERTDQQGDEKQYQRYSAHEGISEKLVVSAHIVFKARLAAV